MFLAHFSRWPPTSVANKMWLNCPVVGPPVSKRCDRKTITWYVARKQLQKNPSSIGYFHTGAGVFFFFGCTFDLVSDLCMGRTTPSVYLDFWEGCGEYDQAKRLPGNCGCTLQVILNNKELQPITTLYLQWTVNKAGMYLATVQFLLSPLEIIC